MELIIQDFIEYLESKQVSKNTLLSYKRDIKQLNKYLDQMGKKMFEVSEEDLEAFDEDGELQVSFSDVMT